MEDGYITGVPLAILLGWRIPISAVSRARALTHRGSTPQSLTGPSAVRVSGRADFILTHLSRSLVVCSVSGCTTGAGVGFHHGHSVVFRGMGKGHVRGSSVEDVEF